MKKGLFLFIQLLPFLLKVSGITDLLSKLVLVHVKIYLLSLSRIVILEQPFLIDRLRARLRALYGHDLSANAVDDLVCLRLR